jgi:hypothetical protein
MKDIISEQGFLFSGESRKAGKRAISKSGEFEYRVTVKVPPYFAFGDWLFARASQIGAQLVIPDVRLCPASQDSR